MCYVYKIPPWIFSSFMTLNGKSPKIVPSKDLGVLLNDKLTLNLHISIVVAKANKTLGFLYHHFGSLTLDQLTQNCYFFRWMSYACEVWAPQTCITDMKQLEGVQRRATRYLSCSKDPNMRPNYKTRLVALNLLPIAYWLECRGLCIAFKCINGLLNV